MSCESFVSVIFDHWPLRHGSVVLGHHVEMALYLPPRQWSCHLLPLEDIVCQVFFSVRQKLVPGENR